MVCRGRVCVWFGSPSRRCGFHIGCGERALSVRSCAQVCHHHLSFPRSPRCAAPALLMALFPHASHADYHGTSFSFLASTLPTSHMCTGARASAILFSSPHCFLLTIVHPCKKVPPAVHLTPAPSLFSASHSWDPPQPRTLDVRLRKPISGGTRSLPHCVSKSLHT